MVSEDALKLDPQAPALLNGRALGIYLFGLESRFETTDNALALLDQALKSAPNSAAVLFNRARILDERGRAAAARDAWQAYLAVDADGPRAEIARQRLDLAARTSTPLTVTSGAPAPPLPLGEIAPATAERLHALTRQSFVLGDFRGTFLRGTLPARVASGAKAGANASDAIAALQIGSALELVEVAVAPGTSFDTRTLGAPLRRIETPHGEVLVYKDFAAVFERRALTAWLHFAAAPRASN